MSDEEHQFESSDAGASKTFPQQAGTIRKNGYIVIKSRPCKVYSFFSLLSWFLHSFLRMIMSSFLFMDYWIRNKKKFFFF